MQLIEKKLMIDKEWRTFEYYPKPYSDIVLHIKGYCVRKRKYYHDFFRIKKFNATMFDKRDYTPDIKLTKWEYSWLPSKTLKMRNQ